jgi:hypothetical protein
VAIARIIRLSHSYVRTVDLNQFQFATFLTQLRRPLLVGGGPFRKWYTPERCHEDTGAPSWSSKQATISKHQSSVTDILRSLAFRLLCRRTHALLEFLENVGVLLRHLQDGRIFPD